MKNKVCRWTCS